MAAEQSPGNGRATTTDELRDAAPGLFRVGLGAYARTLRWTLDASLRAAGRLASAAVSGESASELVDDVGTEVRKVARAFLDVPDSVDRMAGSRGTRKQDGATLRERGAELLRQSADVRYEEDAHPAYERILGELAPDEARILRLLALEGPQPSVDVRTGGPLGVVSSDLVAPGLQMIGAGAGTRYTERVPAYLNNLYRLGLIWFSREPVEDRLRYQVLEAQPDVLEALHKGGRAKTVRRSIHMTPFGEDFCDNCLPLHTAEIEALPLDREAAADAASTNGSSKPAGRPGRPSERVRHNAPDDPQPPTPSPPAASPLGD